MSSIYLCSPLNADMGMKDPIPQFTHVVGELKTRFPELAYLHLVEPRGDFVPHLQGSNDFIREIWGSKLLITSGGYTRDIAMQIADEAQHQGRTELIAFGRQFLANVSFSLLTLAEYTWLTIDACSPTCPGDLRKTCH